jgi:hypothetical protein
VTAAAGVARARQAEAIQLSIEVQRRVDLLFGTRARELRDRRVEDQRVRLRVEDEPAAFDEFIATAFRRLARGVRSSAFAPALFISAWL